jgi:hypothetical protein
MLEITCECLDTASTYTNIMNIIFRIKKFHYFLHLQFKFKVCKIIQRKEETNEIYQNNSKLPQNLSKEFQIIWDDPTKKWDKKIIPRVPDGSSRGRETLPRVLVMWLSGKI